MFFPVLLLASVFQIDGSSIFVDYSTKSIPDAQAYVIDYSPPIGSPPAGTAFDASINFATINGTVAAADYTVYISAIMGDGSRRNVTQFSITSSPDPPTLDSIETTEHEATISYFPPQAKDITFHLEYYPEGHQEYANAIDTKASLVKLRGLEPGTSFKLKIKSVYNGIPSQMAIETSFRTQGNPVYDYSSASGEFTVRTLPPHLDLSTTTIDSISSYEYSKEVTEDEGNSTEVTTENAIEVTEAPRLTTRKTTTQVSTTTKMASTKTKMTSTNTPQEVDAGDYHSGESSTSSPLVQLDEMIREYGEPAQVAIGEENNMLRLDWDAPEDASCEAFFVNYTILTLNRPKSFSLATEEEFALLKMFPEHTLDLRIFCMLAGSISKTWWAHRIANLAKPKPIAARVKSFETDEFYVSTIQLTWDWPEFHDFELYKLVIEYGQNEDNMKTVELTKKNESIELSGLEPAHNYKMKVSNVSTELPLASKATELEQITPPLISSTVYPGQISSTSININFGDSDPEQGRFDHYLLTFSGNNKNISKKVDMNAEKSFTFTKLIPGKTYHFSVYTVYRGVRSRPVSADVTTYPLKVNQLYPVVGKDYVILYWDIENFADSDCRFRLSYNADNIPTVSVELKGASRHRFAALKSEVYYTFTITVIMGVGQAAAESESEMVTVAIPKGRLAPSIYRQGTRELVVSFDYDHNVFSELNGNAENFAVIVSDDASLNDDNYELKSWFEVKDEDVWGSYRASNSDWNPFTEGDRVRKAAFTVGTDDCVRRNLDEPFCNGILRANVDYRVKIRMYTDTKVAMESDWGRIEGEKEEEEAEEEDDSNDRRFPCHMYLNGCRRKSSSRLPTWLTTLIPAIPLLLL